MLVEKGAIKMRNNRVESFQSHKEYSKTTLRVRVSKTKTRESIEGLPLFSERPDTLFTEEEEAGRNTSTLPPTPVTSSKSFIDRNDARANRPYITIQKNDGFCSCYYGTAFNKQEDD